MRFLRGWYVLGSTDRAYGVGQRDPRHDLLAAADRPAEAQTERQLHLPERPAASAEHHPLRRRRRRGRAGGRISMHHPSLWASVAHTSDIRHSNPRAAGVSQIGVGRTSRRRTSRSAAVNSALAAASCPITLGGLHELM